MTTEQTLLALEKKFWTGDAAFYRQNLDESCLVVFTEMAGVMSRDAVAETVKEGDRWQELSLDVKGLIEPAPDVAVLSYAATARRKTGEPYAALVSSGYVKRGGAWKMAFHQQTPMGVGKSERAAGGSGGSRRLLI